MAKLSDGFHQAVCRTFVLLAAALAAAFLWAYLRMQEGNLLIVVFAALSAVRVLKTTPAAAKLRTIVNLTTAAALLQYIVGASNHGLLLSVLLPVAAGWIILRTMPADSAHLVLLTGFLAYTAAPGAAAAAGRCVDIVIAGAAAGLISWSAAVKSSSPATVQPDRFLSKPAATLESWTIFCTAFLYKSLPLPQSIWIVLTVIFIYMIRQPHESSISLVRQRIASVPLGILLGGLYSGTAVMLDHRLAYFMPVIAAAGFFMLYYRHDFFAFSLFFMFAFTVYADWMSGISCSFDFRQLLLGRTLATAIGAAVLLTIEKITADFSGSRAAAT